MSNNFKHSELDHIVLCRTELLLAAVSYHDFLSSQPSKFLHLMKYREYIGLINILG